MVPPAPPRLSMTNCCAPHLAELLEQDAAHRVGAARRRIGNHHLDRPRRIGGLRRGMARNRRPAAARPPKPSASAAASTRVVVPHGVPSRFPRRCRTRAGSPSRSMDAPQACAWGFVPRNRVPPFSHHSRGAIFRRWRKLPTIRTRRRNPSRGAGKHQSKPARDPAKHSKKDPARPTRAKAARPDLPPTDPALAELLNPGIGQGTAGPGSQTGLQPPADNSFDRRADFSAAHRARKSTARVRRGAAGGLRRQGSGTLGCDAARAWSSELAQALGFEGDDAARRRPPRTRTRITTYPRHHRRRRHRAGAGDAAARGPPGIRRAAVDAAPPAAAGKIRRRPAAGDPIGFRAQGRSAAPPSPTWSKACGARTAPRCCSASPAPARPSPWRR